MEVADANKHIQDYLKYYIEFPHPPKYAVMLNGAWGIGKTHLVRKLLREHFKGSEKKLPYKYVSLYGVESVEELDSAVLAAHFPILDSKAAKGILRASGMAFEFFGIESKPN